LSSCKQKTRSTGGSASRGTWAVGPRSEIAFGKVVGRRCEIWGGTGSFGGGEERTED
jgi:hypothetical protein